MSREATQAHHLGPNSDVATVDLEDLGTVGELLPTRARHLESGEDHSDRSMLDHSVPPVQRVSVQARPQLRVTISEG